MKETNAPTLSFFGARQKQKWMMTRPKVNEFRNEIKVSVFAPNGRGIKELTLLEFI
jgi:hypothetical protein